MTWPGTIACFFAGALLANVVPHFVHGISGDRFPTPFAKQLAIQGAGSGRPCVHDEPSPPRIAGLNKLVRSRSRGDHYAKFGAGRGPLGRPGASWMRRQATDLLAEDRPGSSMLGSGQTLLRPAGFATRGVVALGVVGTAFMRWIPVEVREAAAGACGS